MTAQGAPEAGAYWKHLKSGHLVRVLGVGKMQSANWRSHPFGQDTTSSFDGPVDMRAVVIYEHDGNLWARPRDEFEDGRFALAASPSPPLGVGEPMYVLAASLRKNIQNGFVSSMMLGWRRGLDEDAAKGSFISSVQQEKPGFSIDELLCSEVPPPAVPSPLLKEAEEALKELLDDCKEYVRINNLHAENGGLATNHAMRRAEAVLARLGAAP